MAQNRNEVARQLGPASSQEALVKRLKNTPTKPFIFTVPGGKNLTKQIDQRGFEDACWTWLRACKNFSQATVSLLRPGHDLKTREEKVQEFVPHPQFSEWETKAQGRRWLAQQVARILDETEAAAVHIKSDGLYAVYPVGFELDSTHPDWEPHVLFIRKNREEWKER